MRWLAYLRYVVNLAKSIPLSRGEIIKFTAKIKDILLNPSQSAIEFITAILKKQNFILQRIIAIVLLIAAMLLGADIGIDYERRSIKEINPTIFEPKELVFPLDRPEDKIETNIKPTEEIETEEEEEETIVPLVDPLPQENKVQIQKKNKPRIHKTTSKPVRQIRRVEEIYQGPFHLGSSGPNGY